MTQNDDANFTTVYVVDALNGELITTFDKAFDNSSKDGKWIHHEFKGEFAELSAEQREAKFVQFNEMKQAFASIPDEGRNLIKSHFNGMKQEFTNLSDEDKVAMRAEFKSQMDEFSALSFDAKVLYLQELANSLK